MLVSGNKAAFISSLSLSSNFNIVNSKSSRQELFEHIFNKIPHGQPVLFFEKNSIQNVWY